MTISFLPWDLEQWFQKALHAQNGTDSDKFVFLGLLTWVQAPTQVCLWWSQSADAQVEAALLKMDFDVLKDWGCVTPTVIFILFSNCHDQRQTLLCPKGIRKKKNKKNHVKCSGCFLLQWVLFATKGKEDSYQRCAHFFTALTLHKERSVSFNLSEAQILDVTAYVSSLLISGIISSVFQCPLQAKQSTCTMSRSTSTKRLWILCGFKIPICFVTLFNLSIL